MIDPDTTIYQCEDGEFGALQAYNAIVVELPESIRQRFAAVFQHLMSKTGMDDGKLRKQLDGKTIAQIVAEHEVDIDPWEFVDQREAWRKVREPAFGGTAEIVMRLRCPRCRGTLNIRYDPQSPQPDGGKAGCLFIQCQACNTVIVWDRLEKTPDWCESLGLQFDTEPTDDPHLT